MQVVIIFAVYDKTFCTNQFIRRRPRPPPSPPPLQATTTSASHQCRCQQSLCSTAVLPDQYVWTPTTAFTGIRGRKGRGIGSPAQVRVNWTPRRFNLLEVMEIGNQRPTMLTVFFRFFHTASHFLELFYQ